MQLLALTSSHFSRSRGNPTNDLTGRAGSGWRRYGDRLPPKSLLREPFLSTDIRRPSGPIGLTMRSSTMYCRLTSNRSSDLHQGTGVEEGGSVADRKTVRQGETASRHGVAEDKGRLWLSCRVGFETIPLVLCLSPEHADLKPRKLVANATIGD